ncbi:DUF4013 domain-containing protein [Haloferax mediterranei ATCC 33500]|uniref:DUF4013 domain-containing protein n=1 Tax=Haloferax mediterranei (strain ATCC 33500 / DSM 1411 / JCM 8866 / NBRC 14739 / NCIMB 2177 / R-4) TaxID=523841 RepID=I3R5Q2_HALMT|nr:hypothetical protein HFX_1864 [Haloferax mediterranei ATCC 33500]ELZ99881.1 hypothetical protein C439_11118 [Haloferax mediterranei ATCC 33500]QCQ76561.1 DUF4013 domain-containing protein [Haloferax mediterranei ATCC 33500]
MLGSFLIIPMFLLFGYLVRVLGATASGDPEPPAFDDWGGMAVDGVKGFVVTLVYGFVPFALIAVSFGIGMGGAGTGNDAAAGILGGIGALGMLVSFVALFVLYYLVPAALTNMAVEGDFGAAFDFSRLKDILLSVDYLVAWLIPFLIAFVAQAVTSLLVTVTFGLGFILVPTIQFYTNVAVFYMFGRAFGKVTGVGAPQQSATTGVA